MHISKSAAALAAAGSLAWFAAPGAFATETSFQNDTAACGIAMTQVPAPQLAISIVAVHTMMGAGAVGDFDRDGWPDLFILAGGAAPDRLYINDGDGTFTDRAADWGVARQHMGIGCCVGDVDRDGWLDIFVVSFGPSDGAQQPASNKFLLYRNGGDGTFTEIAAAAGVQGFGLSIPSGWGPGFGDYDLDGDLDLCVPSWTGGGLRLFRNELHPTGNLTFTNVTSAAGVAGATIQSFSARFVDMNGDRRPELLLAADFGNSRYFHNDGDGTFTNMTTAAHVGLDRNGMGHAVADMNGDGRLDWYVTSIFSRSSGMPNVPGTGNFLYLATGPDEFAAATGAGVTDGGWGWGTEAIDVDHDGDVDLVETNGWPNPNGHGVAEWNGEPSYVYRNDGAASFTEIANACGFVHTGQGRGLVRLDLDRDGDQDVVVFGYLEPVTVLRNTLPAADDAHWLDLRFDTLANPRLAPDGVGTQVVARTGKHEQRSALVGGSTFASQSELSIHLGLGAAAMVDELRIEWNDGTTTVLHDVAANQHLVIDSGIRSDLDGDGAVGFGDLLRVLSAFGTADADADLDADGTVLVPDLVVLLENWTH